MRVQAGGGDEDARMAAALQQQVPRGELLLQLLAGPQADELDRRRRRPRGVAIAISRSTRSRTRTGSPMSSQ